MTGRTDAARLRQQLRDELAAHLAPAGWYPVLGIDDHSMTLAAFVRPLSDEFAATAEYTRALSTPDRPPVRITQPMLGVAYEPLRRLWPLLGDNVRIAALTALPESAGRMEIHTQDDVAPVAKQLAGLALERAVTFAERYTSVDALLDAHRDDEVEGPSQVVPALLAAAGRFEEARSALARYRPDVDVPEAKRRERRFVYQLTRWIDSGGDPALLPSAPPPRRYAHSERRSATDTWHEVRARKAAVEALKRAGDGHDRVELRSMLKSELAERGVSMDPLGIEQAINRLWVSHRERAREGAQALKTVGKIGLAVANAIRTHELPELPDMSVPEWLEPPAQAVYAVPQRDDPGPRWTAVLLDEGNTAWLQSVYAAVPRLVEIVESATLNAWLDWAHPRDRSGPLQVHLGERRVGLLDEEATAVYRDVADVAAQREELPCVEARLTPIRVEDNYLLEVALPAPQQSSGKVTSP
ncbi:MAG TPA: hypothetical protein VK691_11915 [Solirubrobacteraceae bacterium]|nr:hypothetical protein [Solirubrobacteraceae bacterium]